MADALAGYLSSACLVLIGDSYDVFTLIEQLAILDDEQIFSCDLTPQGKDRKIFTKRESSPLSRRSIITFTSGVPVGKFITCKGAYRRQALELGGNDLLIVLNNLYDDDLGKATALARRPDVQ